MKPTEALIFIPFIRTNVIQMSCGGIGKIGTWSDPNFYGAYIFIFLDFDYELKQFVKYGVGINMVAVIKAFQSCLKLIHYIILQSKGCIKTYSIFHRNVIIFLEHFMKIFQFTFYSIQLKVNPNLYTFKGSCLLFIQYPTIVFPVCFYHRLV